MKNKSRVIVVLIIIVGSLVVLSIIMPGILTRCAESAQEQTVIEFRETALNYVINQYGDHYTIKKESQNITTPIGSPGYVSSMNFVMTDTNKYDLDFHLEIDHYGVVSDDYAFMNDPDRRKDVENYVKKKYGDHYRIVSQKVETISTLEQYIVFAYYQVCDVNDENVTFTVEWDSDPGGVVSDTFEK